MRTNAIDTTSFKSIAIFHGRPQDVKIVALNAEAEDLGFADGYDDNRFKISDQDKLHYYVIATEDADKKTLEQMRQQAKTGLKDGEKDHKTYIARLKTVIKELNLPMLRYWEALEFFTIKK